MLEALLMLHFTVGIFIALIVVMFFWPKITRDFSLESNPTTANIAPILNNRFYLFMSIVIAGFPAMLWMIWIEVKYAINKGR